MVDTSLVFARLILTVMKGLAEKSGLNIVFNCGNSVEAVSKHISTQSRVIV